jgi:hypothetical protein
MSENLVFVAKSTIKVSFPDGHDKPGNRELLKFAFELGLEGSDIYSIYQEYTEKNRAVYIKLKEDALVQDIVGRTFEANFKFESGALVRVHISEANGNLKYVRIFNLIPEVDDEHIENVLKEYGTVKKLVREKFPASLEVDIYTGVRGAYMEINKPLPPYMSIGNLRAKFYYQGMTEGCFYCNGTDHVKLNCPKKITPFSRVQQQAQRQNTRQFNEQPQQQTMQPVQHQQAFPLFNTPPLSFPSFADSIQQNIHSTFASGENRLFAPNNTLCGMTSPNNDGPKLGEIATTSVVNSENDDSDENESGSDENEENDGEMIVDETSSETTTTEKRLTRSTAAKLDEVSRSGAAKLNDATRSRVDNLKKTKKERKNEKKKNLMRIL